jgi:hypothetical protein
MSLTQELEIYKAADTLLGLALQVQAQVPRAYRVAVGQRISNECADILLLVARANAARGESRALQIEQLLERVEAATVLLRAAHRLRIISSGVWAQSIELTDSVAKQAHGWLKATGNAPQTQAPALPPMAAGWDLFSAAPAA